MQPQQNILSIDFFHYLCSPNTVRLVQLVEHQIVVLVVVGSSPTSHPKQDEVQTASSFALGAELRAALPLSCQGLCPIIQLTPWGVQVLLTA